MKDKQFIEERVIKFEKELESLTSDPEILTGLGNRLRSELKMAMKRKEEEILDKVLENGHEWSKTVKYLKGKEKEDRL